MMQNGALSVAQIFFVGWICVLLMIYMLHNTPPPALTLAHYKMCHVQGATAAVQKQFISPCTSRTARRIEQGHTLEPFPVHANTCSSNSACKQNLWTDGASLLINAWLESSPNTVHYPHCTGSDTRRPETELTSSDIWKKKSCGMLSAYGKCGGC